MSVKTGQPHNVRDGDGDHDWVIWDNASNGQRGSGLSKQEALEQAADLELQYDAHGQGTPDTIRRVDPPQPVERGIWQPAGVLDPWVHERGEWIGRVRCPDGKITWIPQAELRRAQHG